jgi:hypothetical protein
MRSLKINLRLPILQVAAILLIITTGCRKKETNYYKSEIDSVGIDWVPDLRTGIFEAGLYPNGNDLILKGETNIPGAKEGIISVLRSKSVNFIDSLLVLPDTSVIKEPWGLVNVSVCNIRFTSSYDAEMVSQALMGTPVKLLKREGGWLLIQTPDLYIGWVDSDAIETKRTDEYDKWRLSSRLFYTAKTGDIYSDPSEERTISDIVAGCIVEIAGDQKDGYEVKLPDGRIGFIPANKSIPLDQLSVEKYLKPENLAATAESFMGIPYLWGGTSSKGFDCSGFVKTVYYLNGLIMSRDASQQYQYGIRIRRNSYPDSLKKGDLLFFGTSGRGRPRATHVGMYIGDSEFIHCSGMVRINSLDSTRTNFSRSRRDSFIGVRRIIGTGYRPGIQPVLDHSWYN